MNVESTAAARTRDVSWLRSSLGEGWRANRKARGVMQRRRSLVFLMSAASLLLLGSTGGRSGCGSAPPAPPSTQCEPLDVTLSRGRGGQLEAIVESNPCAFEPDGSPTQGLWPASTATVSPAWYAADGHETWGYRDARELPAGPIELVGLPGQLQYSLQPDDSKRLRLHFRSAPGASLPTMIDRPFELRYRPASPAPLRGTLYLTVPVQANSPNAVNLVVMAPNANVELKTCAPETDRCWYYTTRLCHGAALGCVYAVAPGSMARGKVTPRSGYELTRILCGEVGPLQPDGSRSVNLTLEGETTCTIEAEPIQARREVWLATEGQGLLATPSHPDCGISGNCALETGALLQLQARPAEGWRLARWRGDCADVAPQDDPATDIALEVQADVDCTAVFAPRSSDRVALDVTVEGRGQVTVSGAGIDGQVVETSANLLVPPGTIVQLVARSEEAFLGWAGSHPGCSGMRRRLELTIDGPATCSARFDAPPDRCAGLTALPQPVVSLVAVALDGTEVPVSGTDFGSGMRLRATISNLAAYPLDAVFVTRYRGQELFGPVVLLDTTTETACVPFSFSVEASACNGLQAPPLSVSARPVPRNSCP
jgi:hypothetical protein